MKTHLHLGSRDLERSVAFYRTLLDVEPVKRKPDYALFVVDEPGIELALRSDGGSQVPESTHYGIAADSPQAVDQADHRLRAAGYLTHVERDETCCYATQSKVWASDPDGRRWETYFVIAESDDDQDGDCCSAAAPEAAQDAACC